MRVIFSYLKFFVAANCLASSVEAAAMPAPEVIIPVKIYSETCAQPGPKFQGSGVLFEHAGKTFVFTSDHVVLHEKKGFCHRIWSEVTGDQEAQFLRADWAEGNALLSVDGFAPPKNLVNFDFSPKIENYQWARTVSILGFPHGSKDLLTTSGTAAFGWSEPLFAWGSPPLRIENSYAEFGMSGGPVVIGSMLVGIVTHIKPSATGPVQVLCLSRDDVTRAVQSFFRYRNHIEPVLWQDVRAQLAKTLTVYLDEFSFRYDCDSKGCFVEVDAFGKNSWGLPLARDRALSLDIGNRLVAGENFPGPFYDRRQAGVLMALDKIPRERLPVRIRKLQFTGIHGRPGRAPGPPTDVTTIHRFFGDIRGGDVYVPIYEP